MTPNSERTNYPLSWPEHWPRTDKYRVKSAQFHDKTIASAVDILVKEVNRLNGRYVTFDDPKLIISTNLRPKLGGLPASGQAQPTDKGVAVYFDLKLPNKAIPVALACDRWDRVEHNLYAIAKHIEALRAQERWGVGKVEQAFRGYVAIPERTNGIAWWITLGTAHNATEEQITEAFRALANVHHPDKGGDPEKFMEIRQAYDQAQALFRK